MAFMAALPDLYFRCRKRLIFFGANKKLLSLRENLRPNAFSLLGYLAWVPLCLKWTLVEDCSDTNALVVRETSRPLHGLHAYWCGGAPWPVGGEGHAVFGQDTILLKSGAEQRLRSAPKSKPGFLARMFGAQAIEEAADAIARVERIRKPAPKAKKPRAKKTSRKSAKKSARKR